MGSDLDVLPQPARKTFCQVLGHDITAISCLQIQGQEGCFGCTAPTRLCETCRRRKVDVGAVGMCSPCLKHAIEHEAKVDKPNFALHLRVACQIAGREIAGKMCLATQGQEGCRNCPAKTRLCENCKEKPVRFKQYGLCLTCSVEEYGDRWDPNSVTEAPVAADVQSVPSVPQSLDDRVFIIVRTLDESAERKSDPERIPETEGEAVTTPSTVAELATVEVAMSPAGAGNDHCKECEKPVWFKKIGMCRSHGTKYYRQQMARKKNKKASRKKSPKAKRLFEQAKGLVLRHKRVSYDFLQQELKVGKQIAHELLQLLEDDGVIGPAVPRRSREILGVASQPTRRSSRTPSSRAKTHTRDKAGVLRQLAEFFGKDSETARVVHEIIADLDELRRLKEGIRKLGKE